METEKSLVRVSEVKLPKFVEDAYDTIEGMKQFANMLLESKLVPDHFYEKGVDNKPDYTKGKVPAVVVVLLQAQQLAIPPMTALQHVIPVNGLLSIKGDLAKTMIFASGKLRKDSWKETVTGTIEEENMVVTITATRDDNGVTLTRSFSVDKAKRMGLWVTSAMASGTDGWKWKKSAWYKTPDRMLNYRALGNLARDLFSDVLLNMYTTEEAQDIGKETSEVIETESGAKITIPDKEHSKARSTKMTDRVADKIPDNKFGEVKKDNIQEATVIEEKNFSSNAPEANNPIHAEKINEIAENESPFKADKGSVEYLDGKEVKRDGENIEAKEEVPGQYTLEGMEKMDTEILKKMVMDDMDMMEASEMIGSKNTNKKLREIIFAHQEGRLAEHVAPYLKDNEEKQKSFEASQALLHATRPEPPADTTKGEIPVNKLFDKQKEDAKIDAFLDKAPLKKEEPKVEAGNKYGIIISEATPRDFSDVKQIFNKMMGVTPQITTPRYMELAQKLGYLPLYADKETFIKNASVAEIDLLLNSN